MAPTTRTLLTAMSSLTLGALLLTGCAAASPAPTETTWPTPAATTETPQAAAVPGYKVGVFPPVPLFQLPDLALLDASANAFTIDTKIAVGEIDGVTISPAHCDADGTIINGHGVSALYADGSGSYTGPDGTIQNSGDGAGSSVINGVAIQNNGDGSGSYTDGAVSIQNDGNGAGSYVDGTQSVQLDGDGAGSFVDGTVIIENTGDGSGSYVDGTVIIENNGDGSGSYVDGTVIIENNGDGTGVVNGTEVEVDPLPPVPKLGVFPPLTALAPLESCGTTITFRDGVLFDFDESAVRDDASATLAKVAEVLAQVDTAQVIVSGHTDSVGSDSYNQDLSEARADAVVEALKAGGVSSGLVPEGYGETRPVAANEIDGVDNPAGRQLNRRVEIFIPAAL